MKSSSPDHVVALIERIGRLLAVDARAEGLLPVHWETLRYLARANRFSLSAAALTTYLGLTKGTVSQTLNTLQSKGLIRKHVDRRNKRSKRLALTPKGRTLLKHDPLDTLAAVVGDFDRQSQQALATLLEALLSARLEAQGRRPFGQCMNCRFFARKHADGSPHFCRLLEEPLAESDAVAICFEQQPA